MDREAWCAVIHGVAKSHIWLSDWTELNLGTQQCHQTSTVLWSCFFLLCFYSKVGCLHSGFSSSSVVSDSLRPHELQHTRPPCPSPTPGVYPNSCPLSQWCHPTISSSVVPFSSCPQSFPTSGSFQISQLFASGGQSIGISASASVLSMSPMGWQIRHNWVTEVNWNDIEEAESLLSRVLSYVQLLWSHEL